ncbi:alpha-galactosidase [Suilimivivens aceti]|uniref:Alpha-galactosidase n=1 Tax=Suilimivivens aceti TaxID=2981774 RepID=A0ABT2SZM4_9FIRM|nr:alpha-galactosidase [Suilimivivens aceti]MCU6743172.1 alpha-galactosidase [Suilimivivens aceti]SCH03712.1 Alpha-galactosidase [uncultured Clostridium sp.]
MAAVFLEEEKIFKLDTRNTTYVIAVVDDEQFLGHVYYGKKLKEVHLDGLLRIHENPFVPSRNNRDRVSFLDSFPMEYPAHGLGDYRESCINIRTEKGNVGLALSYVSHKITEGKDGLEGLPASFGKAGECETLKILCEDKVTGLQVILQYGIFDEADVITRSVKVVNTGKEDLYLTKVYSACLDMDNKDFEAISLHGSWARERQIETVPVSHGKYSVESIRGESSHQDHPFLALKTKNADQENGEVYAMHFVYSGNFKAQVQSDQFDQVRMTMGIHPEDFTWKLKEGESFQAPETVLVYSAQGLGQMTRIFHDFYRNHLIRSEYKNQKRPILINNWEATYFDFDTDKLIAIAKQASALGIEMLVMDDGWFGNRCDDNRALGDWFVNEEKLKGGLEYLVDEVNKLGMKFGIWFEPEMISPDSDLYRAHPDYAIAIPGREPSLCRNQYVLDLTRKEVRDYAYECVAKILRSANIEYVKWDMNRQLSDIGSLELPADQMGELYHRYVLAVYEMQERMMTEFPHLLLENCSGGGARFDPGMLYYSPQIWCSDDTDAIERLKIQEGTALIYPLSTMGAHVSDCPNHTVGRVTPFETRGYVALAGTFGYELDVTKIPESDREQIPAQVAMYHKYNDLVREGDYYRIASYAENHYFDCYGVVSKDKKEALYTYVQVLNRPNYHSRRIYLKGLAAEKYYAIEGEDGTWSGEQLMNAGLLVQNPFGDFKGKLIHLTEV